MGRATRCHLMADTPATGNLPRSSAGIDRNHVLPTSRSSCDLLRDRYSSERVLRSVRSRWAIRRQDCRTGRRILHLAVSSRCICRKPTAPATFRIGCKKALPVCSMHDIVGMPRRRPAASTPARGPSRSHRRARDCARVRTRCSNHDDHHRAHHGDRRTSFPRIPSFRSNVAAWPPDGMKPVPTCAAAAARYRPPAGLRRRRRTQPSTSYPDPPA